MSYKAVHNLTALSIQQCFLPPTRYHHQYNYYPSAVVHAYSYVIIGGFDHPWAHQCMLSAQYLIIIMIYIQTGGAKCTRNDNREVYYV